MQPSLYSRIIMAAYWQRAVHSQAHCHLSVM